MKRPLICITSVATLLATALFIHANAEAVPAGTPSIPSMIETPPSASSGDNIDDPAIWVNKVDASKSLVIGNEKNARQLSVYNLAGERVQVVTNGGKYYGNVDVRGDVIAAASSGILAYKVVNGQLVSNMEATGNATTAGEGLCLWSSPSGALFAINIVRSSNRVRVHPLTDADRDGLWQLQVAVKEWTNVSEGESCIVDDTTSTLYMSVEDVGIHTVDLLNPAKQPPVKLLAPLSSNLTSDIEGLAINGNTLVASSQNVVRPQENWFATFNKSTGAFQGNFRIGAGPSSDDCDETDGLDLYPGNLGPAFPKGIFICQDGYNQAPGTNGAQNFKFVPLETIPLLYVPPPPEPTPTQPTPTEPTPTQPTPTEPTPTEPTPTEPTPTEPTPTEPTPTEPTPTGPPSCAPAPSP